MYDVVIIGAGIAGAAVARELSKYELKILVAEKEDDVAKGTTRANSAIIHAGYDPIPGTLMARSNVRGSVLWKDIAEELGIEYKAVGSLVVAKSLKELESVYELYERGKKNGVAGLEVISREKALSLEPNLNECIEGALWAKTAAIINPWQACIAFSEFAAANGAEFLFNSEVTAIGRENGSYVVAAGGSLIRTRYIVNAAGGYAEQVHALAGGGGFGARAVKGEYYILDRKEGGYVKRVIFPVPDETDGKGVVISPTVHGNLLVGPTAEPTDCFGDVATTASGQAAVREQARRLSGGIAFNENIRNFAGNRAYVDSADFIVEESGELPGFINMAGIKSPGLSAAPALAERAAELLEKAGLKLTGKESVKPYRFPRRFCEMNGREQRALIEKDPRYGRVICRCETVTEGEIVSVLKSKLTPPTVSAVKRRVNAGLGRCQGGFCSVRVHEIIARERNLDWSEVTMDGGAGYIVTGDTKKGGRV